MKKVKGNRMNRIKNIKNNGPDELLEQQISGYAQRQLFKSLVALSAPAEGHPSIALSNVLTDEQITQANDICGRHHYNSCAKMIHELEDLLAPLMPQINAKTGQENDTKYFAYAIGWAICTAAERMSDGRRL